MVKVECGAVIIRQDDQSVYLNRVCQHCGVKDETVISVSVPPVGSDLKKVWVCCSCHRMQQLTINNPAL